MNEKLKLNEELIAETVIELQKMPKDEIIKFLYMAKGVAVVHENKTA